MAIQISGKLIEDTTDHITSLQTKALKAEFGSTNEDIPFFILGKHSAIMDRICWGKYMSYKDNIPKEWCESVSENSYQSSMRVKMKDVNRTFVLKFSSGATSGNVGKKYLIPPKCTPHYNTHDLVPSSSDAERELCEELASRAALVQKWEGISNKVIAVLKASRSLNHAIKEWPDIVHFLPEEHKKRLQEDAERSKERKERKVRSDSELKNVLGGVDQEALATELIALRFATS
jgi:predicted transposase YbfD/YdcC